MTSSLLLVFMCCLTSFYSTAPSSAHVLVTLFIAQLASVPLPCCLSSSSRSLLAAHELLPLFHAHVACHLLLASRHLLSVLFSSVAACCCSCLLSTTAHVCSQLLLTLLRLLHVSLSTVCFVTLSSNCPTARYPSCFTLAVVGFMLLLTFFSPAPLHCSRFLLLVCFFVNSMLLLLSSLLLTAHLQLLHFISSAHICCCYTLLCLLLSSLNPTVAGALTRLLLTVSFQLLTNSTASCSDAPQLGLSPSVVLLTACLCMIVIFKLLSVHALVCSSASDQQLPLGAN